jgi:hypothetical protein
MADSRMSVFSSLTVGEVGGGIPNRILVDGAPFGLLHPTPPSSKLQHNRWEAAPPSTSFIRRPPSVKLQHNRQEAVRIQGDDIPFGLLHPAPLW